MSKAATRDGGARGIMIGVHVCGQTTYRTPSRRRFRSRIQPHDRPETPRSKWLRGPYRCGDKSLRENPFPTEPRIRLPIPIRGYGRAHEGVRDGVAPKASRFAHLGVRVRPSCRSLSQRTAKNRIPALRHLNAPVPCWQSETMPSRIPSPPLRFAELSAKTARHARSRPGIEGCEKASPNSLNRAASSKGCSSDGDERPLADDG